jgi:hypothetical protein
MRLAGIPLNDEDCKTLVDLLYRVGPADDLELGTRIDQNLERETKLLGLSPAERDLLHMGTESHGLRAAAGVGSTWCLHSSALAPSVSPGCTLRAGGVGVFS